MYWNKYLCIMDSFSWFYIHRCALYHSPTVNFSKNFASATSKLKWIMWYSIYTFLSVSNSQRKFGWIKLQAHLPITSSWILAFLVCDALKSTRHRYNALSRSLAGSITRPGFDLSRLKLTRELNTVLSTHFVPRLKGPSRASKLK